MSKHKVLVVLLLLLTSFVLTAVDAIKTERQKKKQQANDDVTAQIYTAGHEQHGISSI